jgi:hypothetical protein
MEDMIVKDFKDAVKNSEKKFLNIEKINKFKKVDAMVNEWIKKGLHKKRGNTLESIEEKHLNIPRINTFNTAPKLEL